MYFHNTPIHNLNARTAVDDAYRAANITPPTIVDQLTDTFHNEPTPYETAIKFVHRSLSNSEDPEKLISEAITAIQRAHAVAEFKDLYERTSEGVALERIDEFREQAAKDLAAPFGKIVTRLKTAANKLDSKKPLDKETAFQDDTSAELKAATGALTLLSEFALYPIHATNINPGMAQILPLVNIPTVTSMEPYSRGVFNVQAAPRDEDSLSRNTIRTLARHAERDVDEAILSIARGKYDGITLSIPTPAEYATRVQSAHNALNRAPANGTTKNYVFN